MNPEEIKYFLVVNGKLFKYDTPGQLEQALNAKVPADGSAGTYHVFKGVELNTETIREQLPPKVEFRNVLKIKE